MANLKKCEFSLDALVCFGYVLDGGERNIDATTMKAILKWPFPINLTIVRSFDGAMQHLQRFVTIFSIVAMSLRAIETQC